MHAQNCNTEWRQVGKRWEALYNRTIPYNPARFSLSLSLCLCPSAWLSGCLCLYVSLSLSIYLSLSLSVSLSLSLSRRVYVSSVCLRQSTHLPLIAYMYAFSLCMYVSTYVSFLIVGDMYVRGVCVCTYVCMYVCLHVLINSFQSMFANADIAKYDGNLLSLRGTQGAAHAAQTQCELEPKQLVPAFPGRRGKVPALHLCSCRLVSMASPPHRSLSACFSRPGLQACDCTITFDGFWLCRIRFR